MNPYYTDLKDVIHPLSAITSFVQANSASWEESADITAITSFVQANSASWEESADITAITSFVQANSASWEESADITAITSFVQANSASWEESADITAITSFVQANSASWEESADILPTVTNYLSTNNIILSSAIIRAGLTITGNISGNNLRTSFNQGSATGNYSFAEGAGRANGNYSHAEGDSTVAAGLVSHAEGYYTIASGALSHAEGINTVASGESSHAEGAFSIASGTRSHAEGESTVTGRKNNFAYTAATKLFTFKSNVSANFDGIFPGTLLRGFDNVHGNDYFTIAVASRNLTTGAISATQDVIGDDIDFLGDAYLVDNSGTFAHAEGHNTVASGYASHAEGFATIASADITHAEGFNTKALNNQSHAEGDSTVAAGLVSHAAGFKATAQQNYTYAWSDGNLGTLSQNVSSTRSGQYMVSASGGMFIPGRVGIGTDNNNNALTVVGTISTNNIILSSAIIRAGLTITGNISGNNLRTSFNQGSATGNYSFAEGYQTTASGSASHAEGNTTTASGSASHAEGLGTLATGIGGHAQGGNTFALKPYSHTEGIGTISGYKRNYLNFVAGTNLFTFASNVTSAPELTNLTPGTVIGGYGFFGGVSTKYFVFEVASRNSTTGAISAINFSTPLTNSSAGWLALPSTNSESSHAEGYQTVALGDFSHAEGFIAEATGYGSHAEGSYTKASGYGSHAEGGSTVASGSSAHAEGAGTIAIGSYSHAKGFNTVAYGDGSVAEGQFTQALGGFSHAAGSRATAAQEYTYIWSDGNIGTYSENVSSTREGQYMIDASGGVYIPGKVGIGTDNNNNALTVMGTISSTGVGVFNNDLRVTKNLYSNYLEVSGDSVSSPTESKISNHSPTGSIPPTLIFQKSRSFTIPQNNDVLGVINFFGIGSYSSSTSIISEADGDFDTTVPGRITFYTAPTGFTGLRPRLTIKQDGKIGIGTTNPNHTLTVVGNVSATGTIFSQNTLTTSICAISGNGNTPFRMQFSNGLLTSIEF